MGEREKIFLAEDDLGIRRSLKLLLEIVGGHTVVGEASNVDEVKKIVDDPNSDFRISIVDGRMLGDGDGAKAAAYIKDHRSDVVIISYSAEPQSYGDYNVTKDQNPEVLLQTIQEA